MIVKSKQQQIEKLVALVIKRDLAEKYGNQNSTEFGRKK